MMEMTFSPIGRREGSVVDATSPTHSIPRTRGNFTEGESPFRVNTSE